MRAHLVQDVMAYMESCVRNNTANLDADVPNAFYDQDAQLDQGTIDPTIEVNGRPVRASPACIVCAELAWVRGARACIRACIRVCIRVYIACAMVCTFAHAHIRSASARGRTRIYAASPWSTRTAHACALTHTHAHAFACVCAHTRSCECVRAPTCSCCAGARCVHE
jgi:hypothetical protein